MAVSCYLGLPGDGKSMSGVRKVVAVLTGGSRYVITNLPLELGELQSYLIASYGQDFDCLRRVVLMTQEQVRKFWLVRGQFWRLVDLPDKAWNQNLYPSLQKVYRWKAGVGEADRPAIEDMTESQVKMYVDAGEVETSDLGKEGLGACYIIDEAQNFWPARSYQSTPQGLLFYLSQHRHVGDDCVFITQKEGQLEKVVRNLVMEFWVFKNLGQRRRLGFRLPGLFGYSCFPESPSLQGAQYSAVGTFRMDVAGLAKCYRTADGVGVGGPTMEADVGRKKAGVSWVWAIAIGVVLLGLAACMPSLVSRLVGGVLLPKTGDSVKSEPVQAMPVPVVAPSNIVGKVQPFAYPVSVPVMKPVERPEVKQVGITAAFSGGNGWHVALDDGRILGPGDYFRVRESDGRVASVEISAREVARWGVRGTNSVR